MHEDTNQPSARILRFILPRSFSCATFNYHYPAWDTYG